MGSYHHEETLHEPTSLSQLIINAASGPAERGIDIHNAGNTSQITTISYRQLFDTASRNHVNLQTLAGGRRDAVFLLHFDNHADGLLWFWSVVLAGYTPALSPPFVHNVGQHRKHLRHLKTLLRDPIVLTTSKLVHSFHADVEISAHAVETLSPAIPDPELPVLPEGLYTPASQVLMLTSGSTGNAKAVVLSHTQIISAIRGKVSCHQTTAEDVFLNWINLDHVANLTESHLHAMYLGAKQVHVHAADLISSPLSFLRLIDQHRVSFSFAPNFFLASLARELQAKHDLLSSTGPENIPDLSSLRCVTSGGEALVVDTAKALLGLLALYGCPSNVLVPGFGMTETCAGSIHNNSFPDHDTQEGLVFASLGKCHDGVEMRVVHVSDHGDIIETSAGQLGQLHLRGPLVFQEYYNDKLNTAKAFTQDGWFITGDLAIIDKSGMVRLAGRERDEVNINGVKHNIGELQSALDIADIPGATTSYTVVFGHRPEGHDTEVVSVVYLPTYKEHNDKVRAETHDAIASVVMLQCNCQPYKIIPLGEEDLQKTSLGKLSSSKIRYQFESGRFDAQDQNNQSRLVAYRVSSASSAAGDGTATERAIQQAVSEVIGLPVEDIAPTSGLMQMGVNSMQLIQFKKRVQDLLHLSDIPMVTVLTNPTVRGLANALDKAATSVDCNTSSTVSTEYDPVVIMQTAGDATPLWLVHPGAGEVLVYLNLAKYFADTRPIYALRARGFEPEQPFFSDLDECIGTYVASIRRVQPHGPYNLLGYSFGSMFAFEVAKRLQSDGETITFLGLLNLPPYIKQRIRQLNMVTAVLTLSLFLGLVEDDDPDMFHPDVEKMTYDDVLDEILSHRAPKGRMEALALDRWKLLRWAEVSNALHEMAWDYEPSGMVQHVDVFVAHPLKAVASNREEWFEKQVSKWVYFSRTLPRFHEAAGEHFSMIRAENIESFQSKLKIALAMRGA